MRHSKRAIAINIAASIIIALFTAGMVALAGAPFWAAVGFGIVTYDVVVPMGRICRAR